MEKQVLLIGRSVGFMMNAIINGLKKEDYEVQEVIAGINEVSRVTDLPKLIVLYLDADLASDTEFLVYLKDLVSEKERSLFVVGTDDEMEEMEKTLPAEIVVDRLSRPLNVKDLAGRLDAEVARGTAAEARKKILIIDDDPTMLRMIKNLLSDKYHVYMANSGMNGITFLANNKVDLILLDYEMPIISGAKVLELIRSETATQDIPVMFLTSKNDRESVMQVIALKPEKYLLKTMPPEEWIQNIDEFFAKR
ncbi:MAG: response regulator [Lachnospiraceae bacterium]|jgi:CheY-like chemotaxis protein|nr:response regulator [Lachnospiraceae bacterium]